MLCQKSMGLVRASSTQVNVLKGQNHPGFHHFMEISQIFQKGSETQERRLQGVKIQNISLASVALDPSRRQPLLQKSVTIYPRSMPDLCMSLGNNPSTQTHSQRLFSFHQRRGHLDTLTSIPAEPKLSCPSLT